MKVRFIDKITYFDEYAGTLQIDFEPQIPAQCDNCFKLEYKY